MIYRGAVLLLLLAILLPISASAQINPFRGSRGSPLNSQDLAALNEATTRLLDRPQLTAGASESWNNQQTGIRGTVTAGSSVKRKGLACRVANYTITGPGTARDRKASLTWCKTKDGWKIG